MEFGLLDGTEDVEHIAWLMLVLSWYLPYLWCRMHISVEWYRLTELTWWWPLCCISSLIHLYADWAEPCCKDCFEEYVNWSIPAGCGQFLVQSSIVCLTKSHTRVENQVSPVNTWHLVFWTIYVFLLAVLLEQFDCTWIFIVCIYLLKYLGKLNWWMVINLQIAVFSLIGAPIPINYTEDPRQVNQASDMGSHLQKGAAGNLLG